VGASSLLLVAHDLPDLGILGLERRPDVHGAQCSAAPRGNGPGTQAINPFSRKAPAPPPGQDPQELDRLLDAWSPAPAAITGFGGFLAILWLMMFKPF